MHTTPATTQNTTTETPMTAKQFWFKNFTGQSIFEVMNAFADHRGEQIKNELDDKLQTAEAKRIEAQSEVKRLKEQLHFCEQSFEALQKTHTKLLLKSHGDDGDL